MTLPIVVRHLQAWIIREYRKPRPEVRMTPSGWVLCGEARDERGINERMRAIERILAGMSGGM